MLIKITEYARPNGFQQLFSIEVSEDLAYNYDLICKLGLEITYEEVSPTVVCITLYQQYIGDYVYIVTNKTDWIGRLEQEIADFSVNHYNNWVRENE